MRLPCLPALPSFGSHDISLVGSLSLLTNTILGAGMVQLPALFQQAGWLVPSLAFIVAAVGTALAALFLGRTVTRVPGNGALELRIEYARLMGALLPRWLAAA